MNLELPNDICMEIDTLACKVCSYNSPGDYCHLEGALCGIPIDVEVYLCKFCQFEFYTGNLKKQIVKYLIDKLKKII